MLCRNCLFEITGRLEDEDRKLLFALNEKGVLNKESASHVTKLTTSKLRDAISRLKGATLLEVTRIGNSTLLRLSESGSEIVGIINESNKEV